MFTEDDFIMTKKFTNGWTQAIEHLRLSNVMLIHVARNYIDIIKEIHKISINPQPEKFKEQINLIESIIAKAQEK